MTSRIVINGIVTTGRRSVIIRNGKITVDGTDVTPDAKEIAIVVEGNIERLEADVCQKITVTGDVGSVTTVNGDVEVGGSVKGAIQTISGDVRCSGSINGSVNTISGDIRSHP